MGEPSGGALTVLMMRRSVPMLTDGQRKAIMPVGVLALAGFGSSAVGVVVSAAWREHRVLCAAISSALLVFYLGGIAVLWGVNQVKGQRQRSPVRRCVSSSFLLPGNVFGLTPYPVYGKGLFFTRLSKD
jgi:hypothetical protein